MQPTGGFDFPAGKPDGIGYWIAAGMGDLVYSIAHGRVNIARHYFAWGNIVLIEHLLGGGDVSALSTVSVVKLLNLGKPQGQDRFVGLTPLGRATVEALHLSDDPDALEVRSYWIQTGWHPPED